MNQREDEPTIPARQLQYYLESLRAAGVEWLPANISGAEVPEAFAEPEPTGAQSLFEEQSELPAARTKVGSVAQRRHALETLAERVSVCTRCAELARTRTQTVFGVGPINAEVCFIGEAPGATEDATGEPFVGEAGQLLNRIIAACGMKREEVYICNIIKCRPPGNRLPLVDEAANCREYLEEQLRLVRPKFICALGACAAQNLLGTKTAIGRLRGHFHDYHGTPVLCTYHPAFLLRSPGMKKEVWEDMKLLLGKMGRAVPKK
jgi:DNA polymerase